ncbi:unnamed protein product [Euphydryas editha]|uniref:C3H1-type domain-containing protein n=1 Tax=Euphydryas editha TaxID=104508 RepID=A0AAU9V458_EUPED|nr:unnamed protein product [Euphydryas editha]
MHDCCAPPNAPYVEYTDERGQLLDTLPVCQDFNRQGCTRPTCRFVHIREGCGLQVVGCRVVVCRDAAAGTCRRAASRYYHIPVQLPPALRPPNDPPHSRTPTPIPAPTPTPHSPAPLVIHIDRASDTLGTGRFPSAGTVAPAAEVVTIEGSGRASGGGSRPARPAARSRRTSGKSVYIVAGYDSQARSCDCDMNRIRDDGAV